MYVQGLSDALWYNIDTYLTAQDYVQLSCSWILGALMLLTVGGIFVFQILSLAYRIIRITVVFFAPSLFRVGSVKVRPWWGLLR
jgi:hypothetical protein